MKLSELLLMPTSKVLNLGIKVLQSYGTVTTDNKNYAWLQRERSKVLLIAHVDTVSAYPPDKIINKQGVMTAMTDNKPSVLGADDRAGIYGIFHLLQNLKVNFDVLFTNFEESGGIGVRKFVTDYNNELKEKPYHIMIELDRQGLNEYVDYNPNQEQIHKWASSFGLTKSFGSFSDIAVLSKASLLPSINVSIGYYSQHTSRERLVIRNMTIMITKIKRMIQNPPTAIYLIKEEPKKSYHSSMDYLEIAYRSLYGYESEDELECQFCGGEINTFNRCKKCNIYLYDALLS
jgi:hypothetical protein